MTFFNVKRRICLAKFSGRFFNHPSTTRNARCDSFGGGRRLGEPSANTPYPLARTFAPPPHFPQQHAGLPPSLDNHPQPLLNHSTNSNHDSTILRVKSKNDFDTTIPHPIFSNHNSTTRKRIREAAAESSSSWSLGEYAVSIRSDFRSTASLPPHIRVLCKRSAI
jgi:hypothetical protein